MSISSLGRALAVPSLREPVAPTSANEVNSIMKKSSAVKTELAATQVASETNRAQGSQSEYTRPDLTTSKQTSADTSTKNAGKRTSVFGEIQRFQDLMRRNSVKFDASGPLSSPELTIVDRVNNIDFEREIPPEAMKKRIFELREDYIANLSSDNISVDVSGPLNQMVLTIKENINQTEFVRHLPKSINDDRVQNLMAFASEQGFTFEAVA